MKERVSQALSSCPMICSCVWWLASAICGNSKNGDQYSNLLLQSETLDILNCHCHMKH